MNITKDVADSRPIKVYDSRTAGFVQAEIESFPFEKRKHIMKERITIRELHCGAGGDNQNVRLKTLVLLSKAKRNRRIGGGFW
jgi:hypothetical protein